MSQLPLHTAIRAARRLVLALACTGVALGLSLLSRGRTEPMTLLLLGVIVANWIGGFQVGARYTLVDVFGRIHFLGAIDPLGIRGSCTTATAMPEIGPLVPTIVSVPGSRAITLAEAAPVCSTSAFEFVALKVTGAPGTI